MPPDARQHAVGVLGALLLLAACGPVSSGEAKAEQVPPDASISPLRDVAVLGAFTHRDLTESSAAVRSFGHDGVYWTLNDSGNDQRLFAFDSTGRDLGAVHVAGARNRDWEALATGPCGTGPCLYIGDVGDNLARHATVTVWRVAEPALPGEGRETRSDPAQALTFRYPDGPRDVEAMWVDADTAIWLATKRPMRGTAREDRPSLVYRVPSASWRTPDTALAELVDSLPHVPTGSRSTLVTDAALANPFGEPTGDSLLVVRTYDLLLLFRTRGTSGRPLALLQQCTVAALRERQGEGVAWMPDGRVLLTSEKRYAPLRAVRCPVDAP